MLQGGAQRQIIAAGTSSYGVIRDRRQVLSCTSLENLPLRSDFCGNRSAFTWYRCNGNNCSGESTTFFNTHESEPRAVPTWTISNPRPLSITFRVRFFPESTTLAAVAAE